MMRPMQEEEALREQNRRLEAKVAELEAKLNPPSKPPLPRDHYDSYAVWLWDGLRLLAEGIWDNVAYIAMAVVVVGFLGLIGALVYRDEYATIDCYGVFHDANTPWGQRYLMPHKRHFGYIRATDDRFNTDAEASEFLKRHGVKECNY